MKGLKVTLFCIIVALAVCFLGSSFAEKETIYYLTKPNDRIKTTHDQGYYWIEDIDNGDPHYGWGLGRFYIKGYTSMVTDKDGIPVFLKNVGDELELGFELETDIDALHGDKNIKVNEDTNGYDQAFEIDQTNFGRGCLIVQEIDYKNDPHKPVIYTDYLTAVKNKTANTKVKPFGEGDYVIALDYEIRFPRFPGSAYNDYTISTAFKIRNSNCMIFLYNLGENQDEITNGAVAENGFRIDYKNSYFLTVNITKQILVDNDGILTLDTRSCKAAADGREYTDEGLYTITVTNEYTEQTVTKQVSVGQNKVLNVYAAHAGTINPNEIAKKLGEGVQINKNWMMVLPEASAEESSNQHTTDYSGFQTVNSESSTHKNSQNTIIIVAIGALVIIGIVVLIMRSRKHKQAIYNPDIQKSDAVNDAKPDIPKLESPDEETEAKE